MAKQRNQDLQFLDEKYKEFCIAAIHQSTARGENSEFNFSLSFTDLKAGMGRKRLRVDFVQFVTKYFEGMNVGVAYFPVAGIFAIRINLMKAALTVETAQLLTEKWKQHEYI